MKIDLSIIPSSPGCYLYKDSSGKIIYIGKAKNLKKRVSSYFNKKDLDIKTKTMLSHAETIEFLVTKSEIESFLLENNLIKKHSPKYNILLKDSKSFAYLEITKNLFLD
jgi:excinuclease ABC subunit C